MVGDTDDTKKMIFEVRTSSTGVSPVDAIIDHLLNRAGRDISHAEMQQMEEILTRFRTRARHMIRVYRSWKIHHNRENDFIEKIYDAYEGVFIRRQLQDAWTLYLTVNRHYHELREYYLDDLCQGEYLRAA